MFGAHQSRVALLEHENSSLAQRPSLAHFFQHFTTGEQRANTAIQSEGEETAKWIEKTKKSIIKWNQN